MKSMRKFLLTSTLVITLLALVTLSVNAAESTIQLGNAKKIETSYIGGVTFSTKETTSGEYLYCVNMHLKTSENVSANLVKQMDRGIAEIIKNGYPNKSITGDNEKDYYITQTAVWWYLDETTGSSNLGEQFKENGSDAYGMRAKVKELVELGKQYTNKDYETINLQISTDSTLLTLNGDYYISNAIKASTITNLESYSVALKDAPNGTIIVDENGNEINTVNKDSVFYVKVPKASASSTSFKVVASATQTLYKAYEYQPTDSDMQNVAKLEKENKTISSEINLSLTKEEVVVPNTSSSSLLITIVGITILISGIGFVYKNAKK